MASLAHLLADAAPAQLQRLAGLWGLEALDGKPHTQIKTMLREQVRLPFFARGVWQQLDQAAARCLYEVVSAPPKKGVRYEQVLKKTRLPAQTVEKALVGLQEQWLITEGRISTPIPLHGPRPAIDDAEVVYLPVPECAEALMQTGRERFARGGDRSIWALLHLLDHQPYETVEALARRCAVPLQTYKHWQAVPVPGFEVRRGLAHRLETSPAIFALLRALDGSAMRLWLWLWDNGGSAPLDTVQQSLGLTLREVAQVISQLEAQALGFDTLTPTGKRVLFLPTSLYQQLEGDVRAWRSEVEAHAWLPLDKPGAPSLEGTPTLLYDLATIIGWVYQNTIEPTNAGPLPKRLSAQIRQRLVGLPRIDDFGQDAYPDLLLQTAADLRLVQRVTPPAEGARPRYAPGPTLASWGESGLDAQASRFLARWQTSRIWQDLLSDHRSLPAYHWTEEDRTRLLTQLRRCQPGRWYHIEALLYTLWQEAPLSLTSEQAHAGATPFATLQALRDRWLERAGQRELGMLTSTLTELGLVELAGETDPPHPVLGQVPTALRLTSLGARILGVAAGATQTTPDLPMPRLIVQPSFELVCLQTHWTLLYTLLQWAEVVQIGPAATLRLTQKALLRGLAQGGTVEELLRLLTQASGCPLPQNVDYTVREWARAFKGTTLAQVFLLQVTSREVAQHIVHVLAGQHISAQPLSDRLLAIESHFTESVIYRHLEQAGIVVQRGMPPGNAP